MKARLAFSTAISLDPDILFVDEALSVEDVKFNRKCSNTINEFREKGRTILLVSHDLNVVSSFCDKTILLNEGQILVYGDPRDVTRIYHQLLYCQEKEEATEVSGLAARETEERDELRERAKEHLHLAQMPDDAPYESGAGIEKRRKSSTLASWTSRATRSPSSLRGKNTPSLWTPFSMRT